MTRGVGMLTAAALGLALVAWSGAAEAGVAGATDPRRPRPAQRAPQARQQECAPGRPCACTGAEDCERTCVPDPKRPGKGCDFACGGTGSCTFHCPGGRCTSKSTGAGATELTCEGDSCTMSCSGEAACDLNDCGSGCKLLCTGSGVCANSCTGAGCSCAGRNCEREPAS